MHWLLIGYMFLFIDRPFEVWTWLGDLHIERAYMICTIGVWLFYPKKRWLPNVQHWAYASFATAVLACWVLSPWMSQAQPKIEDWFKILVFYVLLVTSVNDEKALKTVVVGFVVVMALYLLHSLKEYIGGKHVYRMSTKRMVGVDTTNGDPNSFGASIVFALPMIPVLWRAGIGGKWGKLALTGYVGLSALCIVLTGSRSGLLGFLLWSTLLILGHRKRFLWIGLAVALAPAMFLAMPAELQNRFETIINPDVGPENAKVSGEGRMHGLNMGFELWGKYPLNGAGPGAWIPATGSDIESHNLLGQLVGEMGLLGVLSFGFVLLAFGWNTWQTRKVMKANAEWKNDIVSQVPKAVFTTVFLMLFLGMFGHNLFRFTWLWYGGFLVIAAYALRQRRLFTVEEPQVIDELYAVEDNQPLPKGWSYHEAGK